MSASSLEATKAEFEELVDKLDRCLARGNKLKRELAQAENEVRNLSRGITALWKRVGEEHRNDPGILSTLADMLTKMQAVQDRNPSLPIQ